MFPDQHGEVVKVLGAEKRSQYGKVLGREVLREIEHCVISPLGDAVVDGLGYERGDINKWQVLAPGGTRIEEGNQVEIRGAVFVVDATPFDYSVGRRPVVSRHRPKVLFTVSRGDTHDHL